MTIQRVDWLYFGVSYQNYELLFRNKQCRKSKISRLRNGTIHSRLRGMDTLGCFG